MRFLSRPIIMRTLPMSSTVLSCNRVTNVRASYTRGTLMKALRLFRIWSA